uniref:Uncharacterized protein n=1 Tax=Trichogramma kaykai TaxID=54128 RepID=A0ABD2W2S6_9HYME
MKCHHEQVGSRATILNQISSRYSPYPKNKHREPRSQLKPLKISKKSETRDERSLFFSLSPSLLLARATETAGESTAVHNRSIHAYTHINYGKDGSDWKMSQDTATVLGVERPPSRPPPTTRERERERERENSYSCTQARLILRKE